jgi:hypothetical protein
MAYPTPKVCLQVYKISTFWQNHFFIDKKSFQMFGKLTLVKSEFAEQEIQCFL